VAPEALKSCLGEGRGTAAPCGLAAPDPQHARFEVKVVPFERQEFALPHPGVDGEDVERFEPVAPRGFQEGACLLGGEGRELFLGHLRRIYGSDTLRVT
jgi:hypothetical protein